MSKTLISDTEISRHKSLHKHWINCFDVYSQDLYKSGVLSREQFWQKEIPNCDKEETIFIYGVNSKEQVFSLRLRTKPILDENSKNIICIQYNYQIFLNKGNDNQLSCDETGISYKLYDSKNEYKFPGLCLEVLEPFQRWRIKFNGFLLNKNNEKVFITLRMLWLSNSEVFDYRTDGDNNYLMKQSNGFDLTIDDIFEERYVGCGHLKGVIYFDDKSEEEEIFLWGSRSKAFNGRASDEFKRNFEKSIFMAYSEKGLAFELIKIMSKPNNKTMYYGWCLAPHGTPFPLQDIEVFPKNLNLKINNKLLSISDITLSQNGLYIMKINGHKSCGLLIEDKQLFTEMKTMSPNMELINIFKVEDSNELVIGFEDKNGSNESLTGGKGSSLSLLKRLSQLKDNNFVVPNGFVVTTNAYKLLLKENPNLNKAIHRLETISWSENNETVEKECEIVMNLFKQIEIPFDVKSVIRDSIIGFDNNNNCDEVLVAVRSSACGEDSEDMSAAGQMTTYLGVKGLHNICESVMKCWSSQFNIIAVQYKRGYGQHINTPMAVVVQEMIDCNVAGVMFTCDPISGRNNKLIISANYGIGESVVSATVSPDNISVLVNFDSNSFESKRSVHSIEKIIIGAKESMIKINKEIGSGTEVESSTGSEKCCLSEEEIINLGEIGLKIENYFSSSRDIEWGIRDGTYYLFQSRPITNLNSFNEWELSHELDSGHLDETEYLSRANIGEVMPGAMTPLSLTTIIRIFCLHASELALGHHGLKYSPFRKPWQGASNYNNTVFVSLKDVFWFEFCPEEYENSLQKAAVFAIFGHPVDDKQLREDSFERNGIPTFWTQCVKNFETMKLMLSAKSSLLSVIDKYDRLELLKDNFENSKEMFDFVVKHLHIIGVINKSHMCTTMRSSVLNLLLLIIFSKGNMDIKTNPNLLLDFANVLSTSGKSIVSADVPKTLQMLAKSIKIPEEFKQMSVEEAIDWLQNNTEETGRLYNEFLKNHGFRGYKEWELFSETWSDNKALFVTTLQNMVSMKERTNEVNSDALSKIKTELSWIQKYLLRNWIIPASLNGIELREASKSFDIKCINKFRQVFREMGKMMCYKEGRIPEPELIYFLTLNELKVLTESRDPKIVMKAKQRKRLYPKLDQYSYEEISIGANIRPRNLMENNSIKEKYLNGPNCILRGTPVSTGCVTARVCVAKTFPEAKNIKPGDILVTYSTDICWSPYLPMISGIITEIGGLVSHGAVIAREYGIPCLIGVENACHILSSGETILLDADSGQIVSMKNIKD